MISYVLKKKQQPTKLIEKEIRFVVTRVGDEGWGNWMKIIKRYNTGLPWWRSG